MMVRRSLEQSRNGLDRNCNDGFLRCGCGREHSCGNNFAAHSSGSGIAPLLNTNMRYNMNETPIPTSDLIAAVGSRRVNLSGPDDPSRLPASVEEARGRAREGVGRYNSQSFKTSREAWWDRLAKATTPEEKLGCARMIDALAFAHGLHEHEMGAKLAADNRAKRGLPQPDAAAPADERALARWR